MSPIYVPGKVTLAKEFTVQDYMWNFPQQYGLWSPVEITTALWLDAADASTITESGGAVSQWDDKSGNGRDISQASSTQRPTLATTGLNGKPTLDFDGSNDYLFNASVGASGLSNATIISVFKQVTGGPTEDHQINIGQTGTTGKVRGFYRPGNATVLGFGGWARIATSSFSLDIGGAHHIFGFANTALSGSNNLQIFKDGSVETLTTSAALSTTLDGFSVGALQGALVGNYYSNISVAEIIVLYEAISTVNRQKLEGYLAHKWGLTANLPADHPYKTVGPTP
jgi:hypothetical protein